MIDRTRAVDAEETTMGEFLVWTSVVCGAPLVAGLILRAAVRLADTILDGEISRVDADLARGRWDLPVGVAPKF